MRNAVWQRLALIMFATAEKRMWIAATVWSLAVYRAKPQAAHACQMQMWMCQKAYPVTHIFESQFLAPALMASFPVTKRPRIAVDRAPANVRADRRVDKIAIVRPTIASMANAFPRSARTTFFLRSKLMWIVAASVDHAQSGLLVTLTTTVLQACALSFLANANLRSAPHIAVAPATLAQILLLVRRIMIARRDFAMATPSLLQIFMEAHFCTQRLLAVCAWI